MRHWWLMVLAAVLLVPIVDAASTETGFGTADARLLRAEERIAALEARLAAVEKTAGSAYDAIAQDLAQPMLLLVGMGPCPHGFKRIVTRVLILTRARNSQNGHLWDEAGLPYEEPPGVGDNVYRDLDFCYRPANSVVLK